ncbi:RNA-binding protein [Candidatus Bathyarchaeota archaeon]|nr:RNA-binding protein [Candidatus Bathyarchaeota archaeon]
MIGKLTVAIPASVISDIPHLREKTAKVGLIGRAAAIFRVREIIVFPDYPREDQRKDANLIATLLVYMETPQYLRKRLFKLEPKLRYVGILPPLRTPHHPLNKKAKNLKVGEYREGVVLSKTREGVMIDIGVERPGLLPNEDHAIGKRLTVKIAKVNMLLEVEKATRDEVPQYWGYDITVEKRVLPKILESRNFDLTIATSKHGIRFSKVAEEIAEKMKKATEVLVMFGAPSRGLYEIAKSEGGKLDKLADFVVNTIPEQGTKTVRTEEALVASLAILKERVFL